MSRDPGHPLCRKFKADVWQHFDFKKKNDSEELDRNNAICKICKFQIKYSGNTTNVGSHLTRHHPEYTKQTGNVKPRALQQTLPGWRRPLRASFRPRLRAVKITSALRPFSVVENAGFRHIHWNHVTLYLHGKDWVKLPSLMYSDDKNSIATALKSSRESWSHLWHPDKRSSGLLFNYHLSLHRP